ncbi:flagellar motor protein MotB [Peribacillus glennii]|uniref:Flagellar motor protein MotB n=1 Tax=Peribacillus glennii TaxID=2303991 RepID=A0A372LBR7_9BACI|nr:flagellar motor protein MotB [Peribacillus glennii]RFU62922.1 flagellar motor protein MotB [Peribacillus glennii]
MARKKKHKKHEEHLDESWLVPYADILTLLLALFIVLFASSSVDANKFKQMSTVFEQIFDGGTGVMEQQSPVESQDPSDTKDAGKELHEQTEKDDLGKKEQKELSDIQRKVNQYIQAKQLTNKLGTELTDEGLLVTIRDNVLFESGSADVRQEDEKVSKEISDLLVMDPPRSIVISGHSDNIPIQTYQYESNWDLSVMRAVNFMKILLENKKLDPAWFSAKGYGEFKPVSSNKTEQGREKNRRVEILIMPRTAINK